MTILEAEGFTRAAERLGRTQPAISLQIRRLEELVGSPVLVRGAARPIPTVQGELLLSYARRILALHDEVQARLAAPDLDGQVRLGTPEDFATTHLPGVLARFSAGHPRVALDVRCDFTLNLQAAFDAGEFDLVLVKREPGPVREGLKVWREKLVWVAMRGLAWPEGPLPLVLAPAPDVYRARAMAALDAAGLPWRVAYTSASLAGQHAAVRAGLGIAPLPRDMVPPDLDAVAQHGLPPLADAEIAMLVAPGAAPATRRLADHITSSFELP